jgi:hypothetical protein
LAAALSPLQEAGMLTQENFEALLAPNHEALISEQARQLIWYIIPNHRLTQVNFQRLLTAAEHVNPFEELRRVADNIIGFMATPFAVAPPAMGGAGGPKVEINPEQSTHTSSVHCSVTDSARKLWDTYGADLDLETQIHRIQVWVNGLEDSFNHAVAKRCIARLTAIDYCFVDSSSISTRQLLAIAFMAIHDNSKRLSSFADAERFFIEGLYEIQRGYNLDAKGQDDHESDKPICGPGTFNKIMEKLNVIHSDVEIYYVTHAQASNKFSILTQEHSIRYLQSLASPETLEDYLKVRDLIDEIKANGIEPIWEEIKEAIKLKLWNEFCIAYSYRPDHPRFLEILENGIYLGLNNLSVIETQMQASAGYQTYMAEQENLRRHGLWTNPQSDEETKEDMEYSCRIS